MGKQNKIFKWVMLALMAISIIIVVAGFLAGLPERPTDPSGTVDLLLYWAEWMIKGTVLLLVVVNVVIMAKNNIKSLVKLGVILGCALVLCLLAYALAAGSQPVAYNGEPVSDGTLKLTDTILIITALAGIAAILAIIGGEITSKIRNK